MPEVNTPALSHLLALSFFAVLLLSTAAWLLGPPLWRAWRRERVRRQAFPAAWREVLRRRWPAFARLPTPIQLQIKKHAQVLVAEKPFIGCDGLVVSDEMRVLVACQAALLLLHRRAGYFAGLREVLLYPGPFVVERMAQEANGLSTASRRALVGESWQQGRVILSWPDVLAGAADPTDGHNVVIHEFAHQLDQQKGHANGAPWMGRAERQARWAAVMGTEFAALRRRLANGVTGETDQGKEIIGAYAATDEAEFFAVTSELFFERPAALARLHPALYGELSSYYCSDPLLW